MLFESSTETFMYSNNKYVLVLINYSSLIWTLLKLYRSQRWRIFSEKWNFQTCLTANLNSLKLSNVGLVDMKGHWLARQCCCLYGDSEGQDIPETSSVSVFNQRLHRPCGILHNTEIASDTLIQTINLSIMIHEINIFTIQTWCYLELLICYWMY